MCCSGCDVCQMPSRRRSTHGEAGHYAFLCLALSPCSRPENFEVVRVKVKRVQQERMGVWSGRAIGDIKGFNRQSGTKIAHSRIIHAPGYRQPGMQCIQPWRIVMRTRSSYSTTSCMRYVHRYIQERKLHVPACTTRHANHTRGARRAHLSINHLLTT